MAPPVVLSSLRLGEQHAFVEAQIADYADWFVDQGTATEQQLAVARARAEIEAEVDAAVQSDEEFWAALDARGTTVGWLWTKPSVVGLPPHSAFLYQILAKPEFRRRGYGAAMLGALERVLAADGRHELHLNVRDTNMSGRRLYERAGYEVVERLPEKLHLRKQFAPSDLSPTQ